jgi:chromosomal replication initiation ATPase DnaA
MEALGDILKRVRSQHPNDPSKAPAEQPVGCIRCKDSGWLQHQVPLDHPDFGSAFPCSCRPSRQISGETFDEFNIDHLWPDLKLAFDAARYWADGKGPAILLLSAEPGRGKTHLARSAFNHISMTGQTARWMDDGEIVDSVFQGFRDHTLDAWMDLFENCPWLFVDDLGMTARNDAIRGQFDRIINLRARGAERGLRTCFTTNLSPMDFSDRISSRLSDTYTTRSLVIDAPDYRPQRGRS